MRAWLSITISLLLAPLLALPGPACATSGDIGRALAPDARTAANVVLDADRHPAEILAFSQIHPGDVVADFSAGFGYYSEPLAALAGPDGRVIAQVSPRFYQAEVWDAIREVHPNITMMVVEDDLARFPPASLDVVFAHLVFHDLFLSDKPGQPHHDARAVIANWFAALRPGGRVIIVDHAANPGDTTRNADKLHRIDPLAARAAMEAAGFVFDGESAALHRKSDDRTRPFFAPGLRGGTDRFAYRFRRP